MVLREPDYGSGERAIPVQSADDVKYIRITDFDDDGIVPGNEFATVKIVKDRYRLADGDVLFARSGATAGKTFIYSSEIGPAIFAGYCIRFRFDNKKVLPAFIYFYTKTSRYQSWVKSIQRPSGQPNINKEEFKSFTIPLPKLSVQKETVAEMERARSERRRKLEQADSLLSGLDAFLLSRLGLTPPQEQDNKAFAVRREALLCRRIDPLAYRSFFQKEHPPQTPLQPLKSLALIDPPTGDKPKNENAIVPYVGLPECDLTEIREVAMRPYREVKGRGAFQLGDILFARIEPSVFNKKYVLVDDLKGHDFAFTSTEFYVVRPNAGVNRHYLYSMFFSSFVFAQVRGKTTGSSGRRRIDPELFSDLMIPIPSKPIRDHIAQEVNKQRTEARQLREEAEREWEAAKARFEARLLGREPKS